MLTIPNLISVARLAGVPVFLWLVLGLRTQAGDWWALGLLAAAGASDWLDGKIARALNQQSRLGELLDPSADRLYIVSTVVALAIRSIIGWWLVAVLAVRELVLGVVLLMLRRRGYGPLHVSFVGKAATLSLLYAFPLLFLGSHADVVRGRGTRVRLGIRSVGNCTVLVGRCALHHAGSPPARHGPGHRAPRRGQRTRVRSAGKREGCSHGRRRGDPAAPDDRQPAEAAAARREQADHGPRAAAAPQAQLRRDRSSRCSSSPRWCATISATAKSSG